MMTSTLIPGICYNVFYTNISQCTERGYTDSITQSVTTSYSRPGPGVKVQRESQRPVMPLSFPADSQPPKQLLLPHHSTYTFYSITNTSYCSWPYPGCKMRPSDFLVYDYFELLLYKALKYSPFISQKSRETINFVHTNTLFLSKILTSQILSIIITLLFSLTRFS